MFALAGKCTTSCPATTFAQAASATTSTNSSSSTITTAGGTCISCHADCSTCSGASFDECTSCPPTRPVKTSSGRCLQACEKGQFWDSTSGQCEGCATGCATCADATPNMCMSCAQGLVLQAGKCVSTACPGGAAGLNTLGGVCLAQLETSVNPTSTSTTTTTTTTASPGVNWWEYLVIGIVVAAMMAVVLFLWRRNSRKRRALETKHFKERLDRGMGVGGRITVFLDRMIQKPNDDAETRRRTLHAKLRMSKSPADTMALASDLDLEDDGMIGHTSEDRVEEWRSEVSSSSSLSGRFRANQAGRTSTLTYKTSRSRDSQGSVEEAPKRLVRKTPPTLDPKSLAPKAPSVADTRSVYSQSSALRRAPSSSKGHTVMPIPKEPLKDSMFSTNHMLIATSPSGYPPPPTYQTFNNIPAMQQLQPTTTYVPYTLPVMGAGNVGKSFPWQSPVSTGLSNGTSAASKIGDKNPFRHQILPSYIHLTPIFDVSFALNNDEQTSHRYRSMDIRFLLATDSSNPVERRSRDRCEHIRSTSEDSSNTNATLSVPVNSVPGPSLRRDAVRVLQGSFDSSRPSSRSASPSIPGASPNQPPVEIPILEPFASLLEPSSALDAREGVSKRQRSSSKLSNSPAPCTQPGVANATRGSDVVIIPEDDMASASPSSFSYSPLSPRARAQVELEFEAARQGAVDGGDTEPAMDYLGTGTPILTPRLLAKILQARAEGKPLLVGDSWGALKEKKEKRAQKENREKRKDKVKGEKKSVDKAARKRSMSSQATSEQKTARSASGQPGGNKRKREIEEDNLINSHLKAGPSSDASSTPTMTELNPPKKRPKGWKGYALVEVDTDEEDDDIEPEGNNQKSKSKSSAIGERTSNNSDSDEDEDEDEDEIIEMAQHRGWKGWAISTAPPDRSKLILLDESPMVTTTRSTRSGRTFGEKNFDPSMLSANGSARALNAVRGRRSTSGLSSRS
ncbi:hypothetical protein FRB96_002377 [Tulasnella sp. 330]|nr:hypothetical protein FRB96_002377 [Tulasnella sp. 330]